MKGREQGMKIAFEIGEVEYDIFQLGFISELDSFGSERYYSNAKRERCGLKIIIFDPTD